MKTKLIYVVRHAKSSWGDLTVDDKRRTLNSRGRKAAPIVANWCLEEGIAPQKIITSSAVRAYSTAEIFKDRLSVSDQDYTKYDSLYHAPASTYMETCYGLDESVTSVMLFGHNPGITYLANEVSSKYLDNVPTCGLLIIESSAASWPELSFENCKLKNYIFPKMLSDEV